MLSLLAVILFIIGIILTINILKYTDYDDCSGRIIANIFVILCFTGLLIADIICLTKFINVDTIDQRIAMYEEQNIEIEEEIDILVTKYMEFESNTYKDLKPENLMILINSYYPELKSDQLVQNQINVYMSNNEKIIELKNQKINSSIYRWLVYFG